MSGQLHAVTALTSGKELLVPTGERVGRSSEPVWMQWGERKISCLDRESKPHSLAVQIVAWSLYCLSYRDLLQKIMSLNITCSIYNFLVHSLTDFVQT